MRIYSNPFEAFREVERDLYEMGIRVHPETMQDKKVANDPDYETIEVRAYGFKINEWVWDRTMERIAVQYVLTGQKDQDPVADETLEGVLNYIEQEFTDRLDSPKNPGRSYRFRPDVWNQFLHEGKFAYTYSERMFPQLVNILDELRKHPNTRQAIINLHSNIKPSPQLAYDGQTRRVEQSADLINTGGHGRIPCSMYYQFLRRAGRLDLIYTMRSCDFIVHFPVDVMLALRLQSHFATRLNTLPGTFTYFTGSLHAYAKDLKGRGIF